MLLAAPRSNSKNLILGDGNCDSPIMIIGEAPGKEEEETDCYGKRAFPKRFFTSNRFVKPGLGLAWANCPNSSVFLSRDDTDDCGEKSRRRRRRRRADAFRSPFAEAQSCAFRIEKEGIVNDNGDDELEYP